MKKILIINDNKSAAGGADIVAIKQYEEFSVNDNVECLFISSEDEKINKYSMKPKNFIKNLFNVKAYIYLRNIIKKIKPDHIIVHSWTKQLSSSVFLASRNKRIEIIAHDYFLMCPNGGLFNYKTSSKCNLKGGGLKCFLTNCDKKSYTQKLFRYIRFWIQSVILHIVKPRIWCLNNIQKNLLQKKFITKEYKNSIMSVNKINRSPDYIAYIGRADPEKGTGIFENLKIPEKRSLIFVGPIQSEIVETKFIKNLIFTGWLNKQELNGIYTKIRLLIFPSVWLEVDPLTPMELMSKGIPVLSTKNNIFGQWMSGKMPELIYNDVEDLNELISKMEDNEYYENICNRIIEIVSTEKDFRNNFHERFLYEITN